MEKLTFRYDQSTNVSIIKSSYQNFDIKFFEDEAYYSPALLIRYRPYFKEMKFTYKMFDVSCTAKDGSAFVARYMDDSKHTFFIRKKKRKEHILFTKTNGYVSKYKATDEGVELRLLVDGQLVDNKLMIEDFLDKKEKKPFNEEEFLKKLDEEDREAYLEGKQIDLVVDEIGRQLNLSESQKDNLYIYIAMLKDEKLKAKILSSNDTNELLQIVTPMVEEADRESARPIKNNYIFEDLECSIDNCSFTDEKFEDELYAVYDGNEFIEELYWYFLDNYEEIKEYLQMSIEKVKREIDRCQSAFDKFSSSFNEGNMI